MRRKKPKGRLCNTPHEIRVRFHRKPYTDVALKPIFSSQNIEDFDKLFLKK